jgi:hypothetical protein
MRRDKECGGEETRLLYGEGRSGDKWGGVKILKISQKGNVEKAASSVPCLRRSGYAQAGRHFAVLTYWEYAPRVKLAAALLETDFFDHSR